MSGAFVDEQRAALIAGLAALYRPAQLVQSGVPVSDGRGGFTAPTTTVDIQVQREDLSSSLAARNIAPDQALIFILNDGSAAPAEGHAIILDGQTFMIDRLVLDPAGAVWECVCERG